MDSVLNQEGYADFVLPGEWAWITVGKYSVRIERTDDPDSGTGCRVSVYPHGQEDGKPDLDVFLHDDEVK